MNTFVYTIDTACPDENHAVLCALESGHVIFSPHHLLAPQDDLKPSIYSDTLLDGKHKNISYDSPSDTLKNMHHRLKGSAIEADVRQLMQHFASAAKHWVETTCPHYQDKLIWGRTSYRPAKVEGRQQSPRKDDTRLHVDAFSASPVHGQRILRVFCNINPEQQPRVWHVGEPFAQVMARFAHTLPRYRKRIAHLLHWIGITKSLRSAYDHYQLHLHDAMKTCQMYQDTATKETVAFPAQSSWMVFTDQVSHAALKGQYVLEQTFYLPVSAQRFPERSPWQQWQHQG